MTAKTCTKRKIFILGVLTPMLFYAFSGMKYQRLGVKQYFSEATQTRKLMSVSNENKRQKIVILYSNQRSGSTFMGEIFNKNKNAFYLYEPLFPFTPRCDFLNQERLDLLSKMLNCQFANVAKSFRFAINVTKTRDFAFHCVVNNVCFSSRSDALSTRYESFCNNSPFLSNVGNCGLPLRADVISQLCGSSNIVAFKVLRICSLEQIEKLYKEFKSQGKDVYVIHLLRDPRAIISSKLKLQLKEPDALQRAGELCRRIQRNLEYLNTTKDLSSLIQDKKYLRIRYEDAAMQPISTATQIYRFLGLDLPSDVRNWLDISTIQPHKKLVKIQKQLKMQNSNKDSVLRNYISLEKQLHSPYGTIRDPSMIVQKWRTLLPIQTVFGLQKTCEYVLNELDYKIIDSVEELLDMSRKLW